MMSSCPSLLCFLVATGMRHHHTHHYCDPPIKPLAALSLNTNRRILTWTPLGYQNIPRCIRRRQVHTDAAPTASTLSPRLRTAPSRSSSTTGTTPSPSRPHPPLSPPSGPHRSTVTTALGNHIVLPAVTVAGSMPPGHHHRAQEPRRPPGHRRRPIHASLPLPPATVQQNPLPLSFSFSLPL
jgi:hypothetical protein